MAAIPRKRCDDMNLVTQFAEFMNNAIHDHSRRGRVGGEVGTQNQNLQGIRGHLHEIILRYAAAKA